MNTNTFYKYLIVWCFTLYCFYSVSQAQSLADGIFVPQKALCVGLTYQYESWKDYWEGTLKRDNLNLGTVSTQSMQLMTTYGITNKLNVVVGVPYIWTKASAGTLAGQRNIQDLMAGIKYQFLSTKFGNNHQINFSAVVGGSMPLSKYTPDLLPLSIGLQSKTVFGRVLVDYRHPKNIFFTAVATYMDRANAKLDRESYYTTHLIYSNEVAMPDVLNLMAKTGYYTKKWSAEINLEYNNCLGGFDIRRNDMPFVSNEMDMTRIGLGGMYSIAPLGNLQVMAAARYTLSGRNVGQTTSFSFGLMKAFGFASKTTTSAVSQ
jgi:hypothetical protein